MEMPLMHISFLLHFKSLCKIAGLAGCCQTNRYLLDGWSSASQSQSLLKLLSIFSHLFCFGHHLSPFHSTTIGIKSALKGLELKLSDLTSWLNLYHGLLSRNCSFLEFVWIYFTAVSKYTNYSDSIRINRIWCDLKK